MLQISLDFPLRVRILR